MSLGGVWALSRYLFEIGFAPDYLPVILAFAAVSLLTVAVGMISSRGVHTSPRRSKSCARSVSGAASPAPAPSVVHNGFGDDLVTFDVGMVAVGQVQRGLVAHAF